MEQVNEIETAASPPEATGPTNTAAPPPKPDKPDVAELPACLLRVVGVAAKEDGRYSLTGVLVDIDSASGIVSAVATDGHCMIVAKANRGIFDEDLSVIVPGPIAKNAARIANVRAVRDEQAMVTIEKRPKKKWRLTAYTPDGPVEFTWIEGDAKFPPYADIIPDYTEQAGVGLIGITADLVASTLHTLQKIVGKEPKVRVFLPPSADRPLKLELEDGDRLHAIAVIMPAKIEGWAAEKPKPAEAAPADVPGQQTIPMEDDAWRAVSLADMPAFPSRGLKALAAHEPPIITHGELSALQKRKGDFWAVDVKNLGTETRAKIEESQAKWFEANRQGKSIDEIRGLAKATEALPEKR